MLGFSLSSSVVSVLAQSKVFGFLVALAVHPRVVHMVLLVLPCGVDSIRAHCLAIWRCREHDDCGRCRGHRRERVSVGAVRIQARFFARGGTHLLSVGSVFRRSVHFCHQILELPAAVKTFNTSHHFRPQRRVV